MYVLALRKTEVQDERRLTLVPGKKLTEVRLPLTIKLFISLSAAAIGYAMLQSATDADTTTRIILGILVTLVGTLSILVYKDLVRRGLENREAIKAVETAMNEKDERLEQKLDDLERKFDKAIRVFTGLMVATHTEKAPQIYEVSEAFFKKDI